MSRPRSLVVVIPVFNDFHSAELLIRALDPILDTHALPSRVVLVDDGSPGSPTPRIPPLGAIASVDVLRLRRNLGHTTGRSATQVGRSPPRRDR